MLTLISLVALTLWCFYNHHASCYQNLSRGCG
ncbi:hypothetical protein GLYMA_13G164550v4 [Glycine max]|nr:hypothetical protein GLYMA_13G164550v4 [Glycine max]KAH1101896.1 hypothetical protein GYH30_036436 [Glycine max]